MKIDDKLVNVLNKHSKKNDLLFGDELKKIVQKSKNAEMILPVIGMQGMGKSTLINAVLEENVLPNDADETTCVPVEIKYGEDEGAIVFFVNGKDPVKLHSTDDLNIYVDNKENPANEKKVSHIVLFRKNKLLKNGLTIVDLPGVGSMTKENENTTKRYIERLLSAIFVIPTVPTIRRMEALFIKTVWATFSNAVFVQNIWAGESEREVKESLEYNLLRLKEIARQIKYSDSEVNILPINAYDAIKGAIDKDESLKKSSNINSLVEKIREISDIWGQEISKGIADRCFGFISEAIDVVSDKIASIKAGKIEAKENRARKFEEFRDYSRKIDNIISETTSYLRSEKRETKKFVKENARETADKIRSDIYRVIDGGVYDGDNLTDAFNDILKDCCAEFSEKCFDKFMNIGYKLKEKMKELASIVDEKYKKTIEGNSVYLKDKFKYEDSFMPASSILGALGGGFLGGTIASVVSEWIFLGSFAGPVGTLVGALAGLGIMAFVGWIGNKGVESVRARRAAEAKRAVDDKIDEIEKAMRDNVDDGFENMCDEIHEVFEQIRAKNKEEENRLYSNINVEPPYNLNEKELVSDLSYLYLQLENVNKAKEGGLVNVC